MTAALRAVDYARARGMGVIIHNQPLGIGSAALVHLAAARADHLGHAIECAGPLMWKEDLLVNGLHYSDGYVEVPTGPGWGVEVDRDRLDTHLAAAPVLLRR